MYKVLRLKVNNQYYLSPDINITINPWEVKDIGEVVSLVKSYNLQVTAKWIKGEKHVAGLGAESTLSNVKLNLIRPHTPQHVPYDEGDKGKSTSRTTTNVVGSGLTSGSGNYTFTNLVQHNPNDGLDRYKVSTADSETGSFTYQNNTRTYLGRKGKKEFPYTKKTLAPPVGNGNYINTTYFGSEITWNHELDIRTYRDTIELEPNRPRVMGVVQTVDVSTRALKNEVVSMLNVIKAGTEGIPVVTATKTDKKGRYKFDNLPMESADYDPDTKITRVVGPDRSISTKLKGFGYQSKYLGILLWGQQITSPTADFNLEPNGYISGYVVDEEGNAVKAMVNVDSLAMHETIYGANKKAGKTNANNSAGGGKTISYDWRESFAFKAPSGANRKLEVKAINADLYGVLDTVISIKKGSIANNDPLKIVLPKKRKRIRFRVVEASAIKLKKPPVPIALAKVTLQDVPLSNGANLTDADGYVTFVFDSNVDDFTFKIEPPDHKVNEYTEGEFSIPNVVSSTKVITVSKHATLQKTAKITGKVTLAGAPLKDAKVYFDKG
jgi:hypothetical protein